jgi:hypothetical protein
VASNVLPFRTLATARMTLEVRWIRRGMTPETMLQWLGPFTDGVEEREDRYFVDPTADNLSIKIKDGMHLDLKALRTVGDRLALPGVRGRVELWEKWTFPLHAGSLPSVESARWLPVHKVRRRRSFRLEGDSMVQRAADEAEEPGCTMELSDVVVKGAKWWTLALEATGDRDDLDSTLRRTVEEIFSFQPPDPQLLDERHSMSYRQWLALEHGAFRDDTT